VFKHEAGRYSAGEAKMHETREQWLNAAIELIRVDYLMNVGIILPDMKVSMGWGPGVHPTATIGVCTRPEAAEDGVAQLYINPIKAAATDILHILFHEVVHAYNWSAAHGPEFKKLTEQAGLVGKVTEQVPGDELAKKIREMADDLGDFPHSAIKVITYTTPTGREKVRPAAAKPAQTTRMLKVLCPDCGMISRTSDKWIRALQEKHGEGLAGPCPLCGSMQELR
jgi:hypothetical protein